MASKSNTTWTVRENRLFEHALAVVNMKAPDKWENLAKAVGNKTVDEVKCHYQKLVDDIEKIESGQVPLPDYEGYEAAASKGKQKQVVVNDDDEDFEEQWQRYLNGK